MFRSLLVVSLLAVVIAFWVPTAHAQMCPQATVEVGADAYNASTVPNGSVTVLCGAATREGFIIDAQPTNVIGQMTYSVRGLLERTLFSTPKIEVHAIGQAGFAQSPTALAAAFAGGVGITLTIQKLHGWNPNVNVETLISPANQSSPRLALAAGLRKQFGLQ